MLLYKMVRARDTLHHLTAYGKTKPILDSFGLDIIGRSIEV